MSDSKEEQFPVEEKGEGGAAPEGLGEREGEEQGAVVRPVEVKKVRAEVVGEEAGGWRRDFFSEAMRETLAPFAGLIERKINPILAALESIPGEVERISQFDLAAALDQPQLGGGGQRGGRTVPLLQSGGRDYGGERERYLRPPGAMDPGEFETVCSRCAMCVEACPAHAIELDPKHLVAEGLPYIVPTNQPCVICDSLACMKSCPTGALKVLDRLKIKMGTAQVDHGLCVRSMGEDCKLCVEACPITGEGASPLGEAIVIHAESGKVRVRKNICTGCGLCESRCPTEPRAIRVEAYRAPVDPIVA